MEKIKKGDRVMWIHKLPTNGIKQVYKNTGCIGVVEEIFPEEKNIKIKVITRRYVERIGSNIAIVPFGAISSTN